MGQWHPIRLWHYFGQSRRFEDRKRRKQAAITKTRFKFGSNASLPVKLRLVQHLRPSVAGHAPLRLARPVGRHPLHPARRAPHPRPPRNPRRHAATPARRHRHRRRPPARRAPIRGPLPASLSSPPSASARTSSKQCGERCPSPKSAKGSPRSPTKSNPGNGLRSSNKERHSPCSCRPPICKPWRQSTIGSICSTLSMPWQTIARTAALIWRPSRKNSVFDLSAYERFRSWLDQ